MAKRRKPEPIMVIGQNQAKAITSYVDRLERLNAEKADIDADIKEVKAEAEDEGIDWATIKAHVKERALVAKKGQAHVDQKKELFDLYAAALQGTLPMDMPQTPKPAKAKAKAPLSQKTNAAADAARKLAEENPVSDAPVIEEPEIPEFLRKLAGPGPGEDENPSPND